MPANTYAFVAPTVLVTVANGQRVHVSSHKYMGSTVGANNLETGICTQPQGGGALTLVGDGMLGGQVSANNRISWGLTAVITPAAGSYNTGLCVRVSAPANWNSNEWGYTSALVFRP